MPIEARPKIENCGHAFRFECPKQWENLKVTGDPAQIYGILDRGRIEVGAWADLMLFDPATIRVDRARRVSDLPAGASRLVRSAPGLHGVWVNGTQVFDGKDYVKVTPPGQVLRRFATARPTLAMPPSK